MPKSKVIRIKILFSVDDPESDFNVIECERDENYLWSMGGPLYPRQLKLLSRINDLIRETEGEN